LDRNSRREWGGGWKGGSGIEWRARASVAKTPCRAETPRDIAGPVARLNRFAGLRQFEKNLKREECGWRQDHSWSVEV